MEFVSGLDAARVAEIIVVDAQGVSRRGSGYLLNLTCVLTAWHAVSAATSTVARVEAGLPGERILTVEAMARIGDTDLALLTIGPAATDGSLPPVHFGRVGNHAAQLDVHLAGFPRWKLRTGDDRRRYRVLCHVVGTVASLANIRDQTIEISVAPPAAEVDPEMSPWEGMSGAAVWAGDRIIGVVAEHHWREGLGRLAAIRLDAAVRQSDLPQEILARHLTAFSAVDRWTDVTEQIDLRGPSAQNLQINVAHGGASQFNVQGGSIHFEGGRGCESR
jgi:Trypsin-like peptidase domain